ncbi:MAG: hypothetical protein HC912_12390, partial [Saprospiraceae bacterium]|nr:hypothetical protein [Saprospiraceae bacterium]
MTAVEILQPLERRWRWYRLGEQVLWALALALPFGVLLASFGLSGGYPLLLYVLSFALLSFFRPFWKISQKALVQQLNLQISDAEWSTELLLQAEEQLNVLERLQKEKILKQMAAQAALVKPPHRLAQFGRYLGFSAL